MLARACWSPLWGKAGRCSWLHLDPMAPPQRPSWAQQPQMSASVTASLERGRNLLGSVRREGKIGRTSLMKSKTRGWRDALDAGAGIPLQFMVGWYSACGSLPMTWMCSEGNCNQEQVCTEGPQFMGFTLTKPGVKSEEEDVADSTSHPPLYHSESGGKMLL